MIEKIPQETLDMHSGGAWVTPEFVERATRLQRRSLQDLYPSEAWSLHRTLPHCQRVLDLGCGNGRMAGIIEAISPSTHYLGIDINHRMVKKGIQTYSNKNIRFLKAEASAYLHHTRGRFDCIMAWSLLGVLTNYLELLGSMIAKTQKWVLFDLRAANLPETIADSTLSYTQYGSVREPFVIASFTELVNFLRERESMLATVEISGYYFPSGPTCWIAEHIPEPAVISVVLKRRNKEATSHERPTEWIIKVPEELQEPSFTKTTKLNF